jgi:hypothetical protein
VEELIGGGAVTSPLHSDLSFLFQCSLLQFFTAVGPGEQGEAGGVCLLAAREAFVFLLSKKSCFEFDLSAYFVQCSAGNRARFSVSVSISSRSQVSPDLFIVVGVRWNEH